MSQFPNSWAKVNLFDLCEPKQWKTISTKDLLPNGYTVYGANGTIGYYHSYTHEHPTLMITCRGATCGNLHISKPFSYINGNAMALDSINESACRQDFMHSYLRYRGFEDVISGSAQPQITQEGLRKVEIPLAPLLEQKRIADKLDSVLARVDACRDRLDRLPTLLKRFRRSILAAATAGCLTGDWRDINGHTLESLKYPKSASPNEAGRIPDSWTWVAIGDLSLKVADGVHKKPNYVEAGIPFLTVRNLTAGPGLDFSKTSFISESDHVEFCKRTFPEEGDLLVTKDGTLGVIRLVDTDRPFSIFVSLALIKPRDRRISKYLRFALEAPVLQNQMTGVGTGLLHIHLRDLRQDVVPLPPIEEQTEIVRRVEILFAFADRLEARLATARRQVGQLTPALLAKAFRGELVPQDPADEPATELLKRLAAQRENVPKAKRGRKITNP